MLFSESCEILQNRFFAEHLQVTVPIFSQAAKNGDQFRYFFSDAATRGVLSIKKLLLKISHCHLVFEPLFNEVAALLKRDSNKGVFRPATY